MASDREFVAFVCDNQLFIKPTPPGRATLGAPIEAPPFPGASNWFLMADLDDPEFLAALVRITADALPAPKLKAKKTARGKAALPKRPSTVIKKTAKKARQRV